MTTVVDLAKLSEGVYEDRQSIGEWLRYGLPFSQEGSGYKSALFRNRRTTDYALAIAGTSPTEMDDLYSDMQLAVGRTPDQYRVATSAYYDALNRTGGLVGFYVTGHSLGGGLASMLAKQFGDPTVTFNAPGMSRAFAHLQSNNPGMSVASDEERKVLHICAFFDVVSRGTGSHMGDVRRVHTGAVGASSVAAGVVATVLTGGNVAVGAVAAGGVTALRAHSMSRMVSTLENLREYQRPLEWL